MDLQTGKLYWPATVSSPPIYPPLTEDIQCDALIIGGAVQAPRVRISLRGKAFMSSWLINERLEAEAQAPIRHSFSMPVTRCLQSWQQILVKRRLRLI